MKLERRFEMMAHDGDISRFSFSLVGKLGAMEFWFRQSTSPITGNKYYGGVEKHMSSCPEDWWGGKEPSHKECHVLGDKPCWHDGTSLWAEEHWIPGMLQGGSNWIWTQLEMHYPDWFKPTEGDVK